MTDKVIIGDVRAFPGVMPDKAQACKVLEEAAEVFGAWKEVEWCRNHGLFFKPCDCAKDCADFDHPGYCERDALIDECADVVQAVANLCAALGVDSLVQAMGDCEQRNRERGRYGE